MPMMTKLEVIDELVSEGYDYDSAWELVYGDVPDTNNCDKHSKKTCSECKYLDCCDRANVCDGNCGRCDITTCENNPRNTNRSK